VYFVYLISKQVKQHTAFKGQFNLEKYMA